MKIKKLFIIFCVVILLFFGALRFFAKPIKYTLPFSGKQQNIGMDSVEQFILPAHRKPLSHRQQTDQELVKMIIQIEDKRFFQHFGVDVFSMIRAGRDWIFGTRKSGASTIDQQVIKIYENAYKRGRKQKLHEILSAILLQGNGKDMILTTYLNTLPFPYGRTGIQEGCFLLFGVDCKQLTKEEKYFLVATYQTGKNPYDKNGFDVIKKRGEVLQSKGEVLGRGKLGRITSGVLHPLPDISHYDAMLLGVIKNDMNAGGRIFFDMLLKEKIDKVLENSVVRRETIDAKDCCVLLMDKEGNLLSESTCSDPNKEEGSFVNGCFQKRQVGSLMKPLVYLYAMSTLGWNMDTKIFDEAVKFDLGNGEVYRPQNFDLMYHGQVSLGEALASSLNIPAVKVLKEAGLEGYFGFFNKLRILAGENDFVVSRDAEMFNAKRLGLSVALGTYELSPYEAIKVWRMISFSNVARKRNTEGLSRYTSLNPYRKQITKVLSDSSYRIHGFSNPHALDHPGRAIKTGTSRHFVDGWMCGTKTMSSHSFSGKEREGETLCVWMGNYEGGSMKVSGADSAGVLWGLVEEIISA